MSKDVLYIIDEETMIEIINILHTDDVALGTA